MRLIPRVTACVSFVLTMSFVVVDTRHSLTQQHPQIRFVDSELPESFDQLWNDSSVVAGVRIRDAFSYELPSSSIGVVTSYTVDVLEVIKGHEVKDGALVTIVVPGGTLETPGHASKVTLSSGMPGFQPGREVLAFLKWWPAAGGYSIMYGQAGHYPLDSEVIVLPEGVRPWPELAGGRSVSKGAFLSELRKRAKQ